MSGKDSDKKIVKRNKVDPEAGKNTFHTQKIGSFGATLFSLSLHLFSFLSPYLLLSFSISSPFSLHLFFFLSPSLLRSLSITLSPSFCFHPSSFVPYIIRWRYIFNTWSEWASGREIFYNPSVFSLSLFPPPSLSLWNFSLILSHPELNERVKETIIQFRKRGRVDHLPRK